MALRLAQTLTLTAAATALLGMVGAAKAAPARPKVDFNRDIRPILSKNCFACHGPDEGHRAAGLRLDLREAAVAMHGARPAAVLAGKPDKSLLLQRILAPGARRMPPPSAGPALTPEQVAKLRRWIEQGAEYNRHWAWAPPRPQTPPAVKTKGWVRNPIDAFVVARLEKEGLKPSPEADRYTLLRRASLDLRGLPPTPAEVEAFARDKSADAYEKAVDRMLADPAYGERWSRMWLDLARYADSAGYGSDPLRLNIWPWRDWVIRAFNEDKPYDQFTIEQLAGDLLPNATLDQRIATGFHRNTMTNTEGGTDDEEYRVIAVKDRVDTTFQVWMGVTMGCAKCHTHKYDPITQAEYYQFSALFNQTADADRGDEAPLVQVPYAPIDEAIRAANAKIDALKQQLAAAPEADKKKLQDEITKLEKARPAPANVPVLEELPEGKRRETFLLIKGNFLDRGEKVSPAVPSAFNDWPSQAPLNRLGVAKWLVSPENPLTARVAVNRFWAQIFGAGLVVTEEDFGTQGEMPTHPELLDWMAIYFRSTGQRGTGSLTQSVNGTPRQRDNAAAGTRPKADLINPLTHSPIDPPGAGWSMKKLLRLIVTSATYRQSSAVTADRLAKDPQNRLYSRAPRLRLEAEMVRDQSLALSGLLSRKMFGPSVYPPQPPGLWQAAFNGQRNWPTSTGEDRYRRGLYTFWRRTVPYPSMATFDVPSREFCVIRRIRTNTPLQALVTLNDPVFVEASQSLARRIAKEGGATPEGRAKFALTLCLCRPPSEAQVKEVAALYRSEQTHYAKETEAAKALATDPLGPLPAGADAAELAAWTVVANVLLNLDGVLTRN
ncbi:MAG: PSD1 and planctomycete cytochrome C domain-containing protein [Actinomycetota bacterium]